MRQGFTTGSCAAAAAKAAVYMLLGGVLKTSVSITTPNGTEYTAEIVNIERHDRSVSCGVVKDSGDDPDITNGCTVYACVSLCEDSAEGVYIDGGEGVGRVTKPGLDQPVGNAAINSVPRLMIESGVREVMELFDYTGSLRVIISVPGGMDLAEKTFNPRLGIVGGISILGTSGIVEPMSTRALLDTIAVELNQKRALGYDRIAIAPGNYGLDFMRESFGFDLDRAVKCSNFIGETINMAAAAGIKRLLLIGHIGKLIKVSGGIMNTHSAEADCRMELMVSSALRAGLSAGDALRILDCVNTDEAYDIILKAGITDAFSAAVMEKISFYLKKKAAGRLETECIMFSKQHGLLGMTGRAAEFMEEIKNG